MPGLRRLGADELREVEPHCVGVAALHSPATGIVDFAQVARSLAAELEGAGCRWSRAARSPRDGSPAAAPRTRARARPRRASGLRRGGRHRLAQAAGAPADPRIVPFRGAYLYLRPERRSLVRG